jgi:TPR repeat protein
MRQLQFVCRKVMIFNRFAPLVVACIALLAASPSGGNTAAANAAAENPTALRVLKPLAEAGDTFAQYTLGLMYRRGWNTTQDLVQALKWLNLASSRASPGADRDMALFARADVAASMSPEQRDEAQKLSQEWFAELVRRNAAERSSASR